MSVWNVSEEPHLHYLDILKAKKEERTLSTTIIFREQNIYSMKQGC